MACHYLTVRTQLELLAHDTQTTRPSPALQSACSESDLKLSRRCTQAELTIGLYACNFGPSQPRSLPLSSFESVAWHGPAIQNIGASAVHKASALTVAVLIGTSRSCSQKGKRRTQEQLTFAKLRISAGLSKAVGGRISDRYCSYMLLY